MVTTNVMIDIVTTAKGCCLLSKRTSYVTMYIVVYHAIKVQLLYTIVIRRDADILKDSKT